MNRDKIRRWEQWTLQRLVLPFAVACFAALSLWGGSMTLAAVVMPFVSVLWSVLLRLVTRREVLRGGGGVTLALRSWHALDLLSAVLLVMFETAVGVSAAEQVLLQWKYIGIVVLFFLGYSGLATCSQYILINVYTQVDKKTETNDGVHDNLGTRRVSTS